MDRGLRLGDVLQRTNNNPLGWELGWTWVLGVGTGTGDLDLEKFYNEQTTL